MLWSGHYLNGIDSADLIRILQAPAIGIGVGWHLKILFFWIQDLVIDIFKNGHLPKFLIRISYRKETYLILRRRHGLFSSHLVREG